MSEKKDKKLLEKFMTSGGCLPSPEDIRDFTLDMISLSATPLPEEYLMTGMPILNQGQIGSCVAHACATAIGYGELKSGKNKANDFSRGYIYGNRRNTDYQGEGMYVRQALKQLNHCGDCMYKEFPYNETYPQIKARIEKDKENLANKADDFKILNYFRCYTNDEIKRAIINQGAVIVSITIYSSFAGDCQLPGPEDTKRGGHAMCIIGWNKNGWIIQNSWGKYWGKKGLLYLPYEYPLNEAWGITIDPTLPDPPKTSIWVKIKYWFEKILNKIKYFFNKIFSKKK